MNRQKNKFIFFAKLVVSLGLLSYLVWLVEWERTIKILGEITKPILFIVPFVSLTGFWFASMRWRSILADNHVKFSGWQALRGYLLGLFYGHFLPGALGGDAVRIGLCIQRTKCPAGIATASILLERISGFLALSGMAFFVYLIFPSIASSVLNTQSTWLLPTMAVLGILGMAFVLLSRRIWMRWLPRESAQGVRSFARSAMLTLGSLKGRTLGLVLILSAMFQATDIVATFLLARAMKLSLTPTVFFSVMPLVYLATVLPISLGGLGVREGTLVFLLSRLGIVVSDVVTLSFLIYLNRIVICGMGGGLQLIEALPLNLLNQRDGKRR